MRDMTKGAPLGHLRLSKKVCSPLGPLCEGAPPAGGGGENCTAVRNISGYGKVLSLRPFGAPLPLWRKRHLPRIGGVCLAEGGFSTRWGAPLGHLFLYAVPLLRCFPRGESSQRPRPLTDEGRVIVASRQMVDSGSFALIRPCGATAPLLALRATSPVSGESVPEGKGKERRSGSWPPLFYSVKFPNIPRFRL